MRRFALVLASLAAVAASTGCAGPDGERAQELLAQSDRALADVKSFRFAARVWMETSVGDFTLVLRGGGNSKNGGSSFVTISAPDVPEVPDTTVVTRGTTVWVKEGGRWKREQAPASQGNGLDQLQLEPYVKNVTVSEDHLVAGEPAVKITGIVDTSALVRGVLGQLGSMPGGALPDISESFGDTRLVVYLSQASHLPLRFLLDLTVSDGDDRTELHMDFALTDVNTPVRIPRPRR